MIRTDPTFSIKVCVWMLYFTLVAVGIVDVWFGLRNFRADSVSAAIRKVCEEFPILPFALGVLIGHLLWPLRS